MGEDLLRAIRGDGAANFFVVLPYKIKLMPESGTITLFIIERSLTENATDRTFKWLFIAPTIDNLFMKMLFFLIVTRKNK